MFFNADDDDDFTPSFGAGGSRSNLSSLFGADQAAFNSSRNESLTYTAPKQPKKQASPGGQETPPAVIHAVAAQAFKYVNGQYSSQGKLGVAVLGNHVKKEYNLLVYAGKKQQITSAKITSSFSFVVQPNNYSSFYDDARQSWSLRFDSLESMTDFAKQVGLARYNSAPGSLIKQDLQPGDGQAIENGDAIEVKYTGSLWSNHSFGKVFDSNAAADKLFKFRPGKGKVIKGWEDGVLGMKKGGKRLLAIPPELAYGDKGVPSRVPPKSTLLFEVEISRVKFSKERADIVSSDTSTPPSLNEQNQEPTSSGHSRDDEDLRERTASLNKDLSAAPEKGSEKAKLLARMSKMGKNVLKLPGAVAADPEEGEHEPAETVSENVGGHTSARTHTEPVPERPRVQSHEYPQSPVSPGKPPVAPRSAHVNRIAHAATSAHGPSHATHTQAPPQYQTEYQNPPPTHTQIPPQQQALALYQTPLQQTPPLYQQPAQYSFPQPQPPFQPIFQQPPQPFFQPAPVVQPPPAPSSTSSGTSDVMMPVLMTESRQHQTEVRQAITKVSEKIDSLEHKIDLIKQSNTENDGAIRPAASGLSNENVMEASVLMNSIVKLVQENERMKRENVEKTAKIECLNEKISELLHRSQKYVEQSNIFLEQRNESLQQTTSYSQSKLVELEREKATLSTELGTYKQNFATMETELEILRKQDAENRELLKKTSSQLQKNKTELGSTKETLTEREEELEKLSSSVKNLKQERKKLEGNLTSFEETVSDLKQEKESLEKNLAERKRKHAEVKKRMDEEIEELKSTHEEELNSLKERHRRELTSSSSSLSQQISQLESEMETKWQEKSKQMVNQCDKKWQRKYDDVVEECETLKKRVSESDDKYITIKISLTQHLQEIEDLQEKLKDLEETRNKYTRIKNSHNEQQQEMKDLRERVREMENTQKKYQDLRMKSIEMKEKYERRLLEMAKENEIAVKEVKQRIAEEKQEASIQQQAAKPSRDTIVNEVKQIMNKVFFKIREEFVAGDSYKGSAIIAVVLNVIKTMTLKMTSGAREEQSDDESEEESEEEESEEEEEGEISEKDEGESEKLEDEGNEQEKNENVEGEGGESSSGKVEENEGEQEELKTDVKEDIHDEALEDKVSNGEEIDKVEETQEMNEDSELEQTNKGKENVAEVGNDEGGTTIDTDGKGAKIEEHEGPPMVSVAAVESPLRNSNYSDDEDDESLENRGIDELPPTEEAEDRDDNLGVVEDNANSEGNLEDISNKSLHGSERNASISSEDENIVGNVEQNEVKHGPLMSDLPSVDELSNTSKDIEDIREASGNQGESVDNKTSNSEVESKRENENNAEAENGDEKTAKSKAEAVDELSNMIKDIEDTREASGSQGESVDNNRSDIEVENKGENENNAKAENGDGKTAKSEAEVDIAQEEKSEKKIESLSDFLSDEEDDVQGLFDTPAPKTIPTPAKKEEGTPAKAIPPPLFDDDDDDDLDWFS